MKTTSGFFIGMGMIIFVLCAAAAVCLVFSDLIPSWNLINLPVHSTIETLGGISALLIAMVLLQQKRKTDNESFYLVGTGFACMGVLDTFHAMCMPGDAFIFLHSAASLAGGFFFAGVLLPDKLLLRYRAEQSWIAGLFVLICFSVGLRALIFPQDVPMIIRLYDGQFTLAAILLNTCASLFFLVSVPKFYIRYRSTQNTDHLVFLLLALFFGLAEIIFQYSDTWNDIWWAWHLLRFIAYIMILFFVGKRHFQLAKCFQPNQSLSPKNSTTMGEAGKQ
ncbi:MAG: hypothetical protein KKD44_04045 [Proteobacteria bacterium]|nr:hypothetical protein [Pseudomonadota bacterium]